MRQKLRSLITLLALMGGLLTAPSYADFETDFQSQLQKMENAHSAVVRQNAHLKASADLFRNQSRRATYVSEFVAVLNALVDSLLLWVTEIGELNAQSKAAVEMYLKLPSPVTASTLQLLKDFSSLARDSSQTIQNARSLLVYIQTTYTAQSLRFDTKGTGTRFSQTLSKAIEKMDEMSGGFDTVHTRVERTIATEVLPSEIPSPPGETGKSARTPAHLPKEEAPSESEPKGTPEPKPRKTTRYRSGLK